MWDELGQGYSEWSRPSHPVGENVPKSTLESKGRGYRVPMAFCAADSPANHPVEKAICRL